MQTFKIIKDCNKTVKRFNLRGRTLEFMIQPVPKGQNPGAWVHRAIEDIILHATQDVDPTDKVGFTFCSKDFKRGQGWKNFDDAANVTVDDVWGVVSGIFQSNSMGLNTDTFCLGVTTVRMPKGKGNKRQNKYNTFDEECAMRRGIITINNSDNLCLPRAIVVAIASVEKDSDFKKVRQDTAKLQLKRALKLMEDTSVTIPHDGGGIPELQQFQRYFAGKYNICVYRYGNKGRDVMFKGENEGGCSLNLLHHNGHYNVITSLTAAFCCSYYCEHCNVPYDNRNKHRCGGTCQACQQTPACVTEVKIRCSDCNRWFKSEHCFANHLKLKSLGKNTVCSQIACCPTCMKTIKLDRAHVCGEVYCKICRKHAPQDHLCYMLPDTGCPKTKDFLFVFYDLETRQEKVVDENTVEHEPNLCVFKQCCDKCINENSLYLCQNCGVKLQILNKKIVIERFMSYLLASRKKFKNIVVLAHNGQAFDHQFLLNYILTQTDLTPELIMRGTKIISMVLGNIKFIDSLNYFPMALTKLPKAFGLGDGLKKGYFPHLFNILENENYIGPMPDLKYYSPDTMRTNERDTFLAWYEEHKNDTFDMQRNLVEYCISDVEILAQACLKFRDQLISTGNVCPFTEACTIASACNKVFRRNFLKTDTIGIIPRGGYRGRDNYSKIATQWLVWEEHMRNINILHAAKQKEVTLNGHFKVDGYCAETKQVFEFHGCYYHGHPECQKFGRDKPLNDDPTQTLNLRYESTVAKTDRLRALDYEVIEMWECNFRQQLQNTPDMKNYTTASPLVINTPLNPRDAFYGGRTGNTRTYYKCENGEKINYIDICSLYPFVCKNGKYPVGHPTVYVGAECPKDIFSLNGLIKCTMLPPENLYHPVLPAKINNKLMFTLCYTCAQNFNNDECTHSEAERAISGTWVIDEIIKAVEKGYKLVKTDEIWVYNVVQYNNDKNNIGLFTEMMNKFLKIKQQASGWPKNCTTKEEKNVYIKEFLNQEGIKLDFENILENPGLRALAKLMLNSFWGKLGQRENQPKTKIINDTEEFFQIMSNPGIIVNTVLPINDNTLVVNYEHTEETYDVLSTVNVCLAAYTTTQARLKLFSYLEQLGERVLYYDTDSVIFVSKPGDIDPALGNCVGDMTNELCEYGAGSYITEFVSGGPKNYAYIVYSPETDKYTEVCKVKGIAVNYEVSKDVNLKSLKEMIIEGKEPKKIIFKAIRRTKLHQVITHEERKVFKTTSTKRKFIDYNSVPYGYKKQKM